MPKTKDKKETPLMKQYYAIKAKHPGAILLFRVGDFYETFAEDAEIASKILGIVLTKRANGSASEVALAGFPHHSLESYLPKLVRAGQRVAICDQLEDPSTAKGIVKRGVTELVTPGVSFNDNVLDQDKNNYLASIYNDADLNGIAFLDISTGQFMLAQGSSDYIEKLLQGFQPREVLYRKSDKKVWQNKLDEKYHVYYMDDWIYTFDFANETLINHFQTQNLKGFGIENQKLGITAAGAILQYLDETEHRNIDHINSISRIEEEHYVWLDKFTIRNLELIYAQREDGIPLVEILDKTQTPMGSRLLRNWMVLPLKDEVKIKERLSMVRIFVEESGLRENIVRHLKAIGDLERIIAKVAARRINPREMLQLKKALQSSLPVIDYLIDSEEPLLIQLADSFNKCETLLEKIENELLDDVPIVFNQGNLFRDGIDEEIDELRKIARSGKDYLVEIQQRESERTGIPKLKIAYNKVFGYYLEVSNAQKDKVPDEWIRKQTLVNAERYITEELKSYEEKILNADDRLKVIEHNLYIKLVEVAGEYVQQIQKNAKLLAQLDCLISFAHAAVENNYAQPEINSGKALNIKNGRHPVIEKQMPPGESYIPNDIFLDDELQQIIIITGPNMSGKSALLRQTALIVLMGQMGSFVPASKAEIGLVDKVFTRVGASDNLSKGESTFMVEMTETASILNNLSDRSLVLMDEIGRGTSTYDGISIAWSIVEFLHNKSDKKAKTLFASHYHELNELANDLERVKNYNVSVKEVADKVIFMRKLKPGGSEHSFGIHVAQMAGMPNEVVLRAHEIMIGLEQEKVSAHNKEKLKEIPKSAEFQMSMFEANDPNYVQVKEILEQLDINRISPVEALLKLNEIKTVMQASLNKKK
ncbi:DNA mismatch repair protein MutS [Hyphobacterium sp. CCMP332]|nr:DNA mismatch repair protein MutS [Hyphobacterium sp. CCMP332]